MRRLSLLVAAPLLAAMVVSGCGSGGTAGGGGTGSVIPKGEPATLSAPLPSAIMAKGQLEVGVKCDYPPFGFVDAGGKNAGYGIELAHKMASYAFGDPAKVKFTCVTGSNRTPYLDANKIDLIVASMSYTPDRAKVINFSTPYFSSGVKLLVLKDSPVKGFPDVKGENVVTIKGTTASIWMTQCLPTANQLTYNQTSEALTALDQKRGVAFAQDDTLLVDIASKNDKYTVTGTAQAASPWGMGTRLSDKEFAAWVDAALAKMQQEDFFWKAFTGAVTDKAVQEQFKTFVPRPDNSLKYAQGSVYKC